MNIVIAGGVVQYITFIEEKRREAIANNVGGFDRNNWKYANNWRDLAGHSEQQGDKVHFVGEYWLNPLHASKEIRESFPNWEKELQ